MGGKNGRKARTRREKEKARAARKRAARRPTRRSRISLLAEIGSLDDDDGTKRRNMRIFFYFLEKALSIVTDFHRGGDGWRVNVT